jgi:hypothetical protein
MITFNISAGDIFLVISTNKYGGGTMFGFILTHVLVPVFHAMVVKLIFSQIDLIDWNEITATILHWLGM